jgi:hypothetical protein
MAIDRNIENMLELLEDLAHCLEESESTPYASSEPAELATKVRDMIDKLKNSNVQHLGVIKFHFLPTGSYQEISMKNNWDEDYLIMASDFDSLYHRIINNKPGKSMQT